MLFGSSFSHTRHSGTTRPSTGNVCVVGLRLSRIDRPRLHLDGGHRLAVGAVDAEDVTRLAAVQRDLAHLAADVHVREHGRMGVVHVPDVVTDRLVMPLERAGLRVERHERVGEQVVAGARGAVLRRAAAAHVAERDHDRVELGIDRAVDPGRGPRHLGASGIRPHDEASALTMLPFTSVNTRLSQGSGLSAPKKNHTNAPSLERSAKIALRVPSLVPT